LANYDEMMDDNSMAGDVYEILSLELVIVDTWRVLLRSMS